MTIIDIVIAAVLVLGLWRGFVSGATKTAVSLLAWLAALIAASALAKPLSFLFINIVTIDVMQIALAFLSIVICVLILARLVTYLFLKVLKVLRLSFLDKLLGAALGVALGTLKVLITLSVISPLLVRLPSWSDSVIAQSLLPFAPIARILAQEAFDEIQTQIQNPYQ